MKRFLLSTLLLLAVGTLPMLAQLVPVNPKEGAISKEEVAMTQYQGDTTAVALILYEENIVDISVDVSFSLKKQVFFRTRIKILKEDGKEYADFKIPVSRDPDDNEAVSGIRVTTYNLVDGAVKKTKLDKKYVFKENATDQVAVYSFSAPEVRVGSVIEVSYTLKSNRYWDIPLIDLQYEIPINCIDARFQYANYMAFNRLVHGARTPLYQTDSEVRTMRVGEQSIDYKLYSDIYRAVNVPALEEDSYSFCPDQYLSAVEYELSSFSVPGYVYRDYSKTWSDVDEAVLDSPIVKECHTRYPDLAECKEKVSGIEDETEQICTVRNYVMNSVSWNGKRGLVPESVSKTLKSGTGSTASVNAAVASALNGLGFKADPVLIKVRSEGILADFHVSSSAFNTFILRVTTPGGAVHYLDAARSDAYPDVLDPDYLVDRGRLILPHGQSEWVDLQKLVKNSQVMSVQAKVDEDGQVSATVIVNGKNEYAYSMKRRRHNADSEEAFIEDLEEGTDLEISDFVFKGDEYSPSAAYEFSITQEATVSGDRMYIRPFIFTFHSESAFRNPTRTIPIDFSYGESIAYTYMLEIPEGYAVEQLPKSVRIVASGIQAEARCQFAQTDPTHIQVRYTFKNDTLIAPADTYQDIRTFWEQLCNIYKNTVVLKKQ